MITIKYPKDPDATLDYGFDWSPWLEEDETLATSEWILSDGLTKGIRSEDIDQYAGVDNGWRRRTELSSHEPDHYIHGAHRRPYLTHQSPIPITHG